MLRSPAVAIAVLALAVTAACGDDGDEGSAGPRYAGVVELAAELDAVADGCTLEYEGLQDPQREVSVCTLGDDVAELSVWEDLQALEDLIASAEESGDPVVAGPNWSVDVTDEGVAADVAEATGGAVHP